jgi:hypothetical protein
MFKPGLFWVNVNLWILALRPSGVKAQQREEQEKGLCLIYWGTTGETREGKAEDEI